MSTETPADRPAEEPAAPSTAVFPAGDREALAALLAPHLRPMERAGDDLTDLDVLIDARPLEVVDALFAAGVLVHDETTDRAHLRKAWAAMSTALVHLAQGQPLDAAVLAAVPKSHQVYLLGHQARGAQLADTWRQLLGAREALAAILARGTAPSPIELGAILGQLGGDDPYAGGRPAGADPWWGCWTDEAALPEEYDWERYTRTIDPGAQIDGLGDLCAFLGGTWSESPESESITAKVLKLIVKAQATPDKFARICRAFPREAAAWRAWMSMVDHSPTAAELYAELVAGLPAVVSARVAGRLARLHGEGRPAPVYADDPARLDTLVAERAAAYADAVSAPSVGGIVSVDREKLRPGHVGGYDLRVQIPEGARAYALPWPAGTRADYDPATVVLRETGRDRTGMADSEVMARHLVVTYGPGGGDQIALGMVRRLTEVEKRTPGLRWWECRHCELGAVSAVSAAAEQAECFGHEAICPDQDRLRTGVPRDGGRPASAISPGDPDWVPGFGPVPGASLGNLGEDR